MRKILGEYGNDRTFETTTKVGSFPNATNVRRHDEEYTLLPAYLAMNDTVLVRQVRSLCVAAAHVLCGLFWREGLPGEKTRREE